MLTDEEYLAMRQSLRSTTKQLSRRDQLRLVQNDTSKVGDFAQKIREKRIA
jgi:hypothetical protein